MPLGLANLLLLMLFYACNATCSEVCLVIVIDGAFDDLQNVLTSIGVLELGAQSYLLILLCKGPSEACAGDVKDLVKAAKIVVVSKPVDPP